jgi:hypothetical protein
MTMYGSQTILESSQAPPPNNCLRFVHCHYRSLYLIYYIYREPVNTEGELRDRIQDSFATITPQMIMDSKLSLLRRARLCLEMNGGHFDHVL